MRNLAKTWLFIVSFMAILPSANSRAETRPTAEEIAEKAFGKAFAGLQKGTAKVTMLLEGSGRRDEGKSQVLSFKSMRGKDGLLRYLVRFEAPLAKKGMAFLVREKKDALPDSWLYVAKTLSQMAAGNATGAFFGSDFIYADMLPYPKDNKGDVTLKLLEDAKIGPDDCYQVQILITNPQSPYGKIVASVRKKGMIASQIEFYDQAQKALKTMKVLKLEKIGGEMVPVQLEMKRADSDKKTTLTISEMDPAAKLEDADFDPGKLALY